MLLGIPFIEVRDDALRQGDVERAGALAPPLGALLESMVAPAADDRPTAAQVAAGIKGALKRL